MNDSPQAAHKQRLRGQLRKQRKAVSSKQKAAEQLRIQQHLQTFLRTLPGGLICAYASTPSEIDVLPVLASLQQWGWHTALPVIATAQAGKMDMHLWATGELLLPNRYGIMEPATTSRQLAPSAFDVCLLPMLGFTRSGKRLGMGGGYYDRWLADCRSSMLRIGIASQSQQCSTLPTDAWDQDLHYVCTELGLLDCQQQTFIQH